MLNLADKLKSLRKQKKLTQMQVAERLWVTKSIISAYESGIRYPSLDMLVKLAQTYSVSTDYLLGVDKKQVIEVSDLSEEQVAILKSLVDEFRVKR